MKDYYEVLDIPSNALQESINEQYRFLIQAWHPDKFPNPAQKAKAEEKTKEINEAYEVLRSPTRRAQYDNRERSSSRFDEEQQQEKPRADEETIAELFDRSNLLAEHHDIEGSIRVLSELIKLSPYPPAYVNRALGYLDVFRSNESSSEGQARSLLFKAKDDFTKAIELYKRMPAGNFRENDGDDVLSICFYERGKINLLLGAFFKWEDTADIEEKKRKLFNNDTETLQQAVNDANESIKHNRDKIEAYSLKGDIYESYFDDPETAIEQYSKAISINATSLDYFKRAWCNYLVGNISNSSSDYKSSNRLGLDEDDLDSLRWSAIKSGKSKRWMSFLQEME